MNDQSEIPPIVDPRFGMSTITLSGHAFKLCAHCDGAELASLCKLAKRRVM